MSAAWPSRLQELLVPHRNSFTGWDGGYALHDGQDREEAA